MEYTAVHKNQTLEPDGWSRTMKDKVGFTLEKKEGRIFLADKTR